MAKYSFKLPELGEGLVEGEVVKWHVAVGDQIEEDDVLVEIQNDKAVVEVPSPVTGVIQEIRVEPGVVSEVGDVLAVLEVEGEGTEDDAGTEGETPTADETLAPAASGESTGEQEEQAGGEHPAAATSGAGSQSEAGAAAREVLATPGVRRFAREQGVDLQTVTGTGKNGRITREDVEQAASGQAQQPSVEASAGEAEQAEPSVAEADSASATTSTTTTATDFLGEVWEERVPLRGIRRAIARAMVKSVYTAPHVTIMDEVDVSKLVELREEMKPLMEQKGTKVTYLPFIAKALIAALRNYPSLNATLDDEKDEIVYKKYYNIGIATDTEQGLMVPVIKHADRKNIWTIAEQIRELATKARDGKLSMDEMKDGTFSITNIGSAGGKYFTPVINHPEVAILGTGRISPQPVVRDGELAVGQVMALSLSFDHRIIDGATAQYALNDIKQLLENPQLLIMEV